MNASAQPPLCSKCGENICARDIRVLSVTRDDGIETVRMTGVEWFDRCYACGHWNPWHSSPRAYDRGAPGNESAWRMMHRLHYLGDGGPYESRRREANAYDPTARREDDGDAHNDAAASFAVIGSAQRHRLDAAWRQRNPDKSLTQNRKWQDLERADVERVIRPTLNPTARDLWHLRTGDRWLDYDSDGTRPGFGEWFPPMTDEQRAEQDVHGWCDHEWGDPHIHAWAQANGRA